MPSIPMLTSIGTRVAMIFGKKLMDPLFSLLPLSIVHSLKAVP